MKKQKKPVPSAEAEPVIKKQPLLKRLLFGPERPDLSELEAGSTTILDILSPTAIDTKSRDYIVVDGVFHAYLYITGYGYSTTVGSCWLAPLVEAGEGVNISFSFTRQNREKILSKVAQTTMLNRSRMRDVGDTRQDYEELDSAITSGLYLKDVMNRQGEDFYYMHTLIEVVADDPDTLEQRVTAVEKLCVSVDMIARRCDYANEQGFLSTLPLVTLDADIERRQGRLYPAQPASRAAVWQVPRTGNDHASGASDAHAAAAQRDLSRCLCGGRCDSSYHKNGKSAAFGEHRRDAGDHRRVSASILYPHQSALSALFSLR